MSDFTVSPPASRAGIPPNFFTFPKILLGGRVRTAPEKGIGTGSTQNMAKESAITRRKSNLVAERVKALGT